MCALLLSEEKDDSNATSECKQNRSSESAMAHNVSKKVAPPPGFRDISVVKDGNMEVKPAGSGHHGDIEPPPGFKGETPQASKGSKRLAEESEERQAKKLKGTYRCSSLFLMFAYCYFQSFLKSHFGEQES